VFGNSGQLAPVARLVANAPILIGAFNGSPSGDASYILRAFDPASIASAKDDAHVAWVDYVFAAAFDFGLDGGLGVCAGFGLSVLV